MSKSVSVSLSTRERVFDRRQFSFQLVIIDSDFDNDLLYSLRIFKDTWSELESSLADADVELCSALVEHFGPAIKIRLRGGSIYDEYTNQYFSLLMDLLSESGVLVA